ncbi:efflux RND transporter periplasmic adaptor subunit [Sphingomonas montanisoli]|uniref:Efflux RND transporter periplasmic adaptor subunit n=1 Tax=Sphingomonas montanisoli TaxID=2606412 RepID=A0A5D9CEW9_9SPHN|nr:efflux RND transporter periplasmic adaptor subunit [Sphingomonas montanisoli]TZG28661.1 efflux RND transporter periplasmic adaptor subunit [Sphingomonas montanisoli]
MNVETGIRQDAPEYGAYAWDEERAKRRRLILIGVVAVALIAALLVAKMVFGGKKPAAAPDSAPVVTVIVPGKTEVSATIAANGTLAAKREMPVGVAGEGGQVKAVLVEPGDWVQAGQVLATIERSVQSQQASSLAASVQVARADASIAQLEYDRAKALVSRGFISKADLDRRGATRDAANARVSVAQAQLGQQRATIGRLDIRSPAAGLVLTRAVEPGQVVGPGNGALFRVAKGGEMEIRAALAEQDLARLKVGSIATVTPVGSAQKFSGSVWQLSPIIDATTRQGVARIQLAYNPALRPGGFAAAEIVAGKGLAPLLPESAVLSEPKGGNYVYVIEGGKVVKRTVKVGDVSDTGVSVLSGLNGNEQVVYSAGAFLNPGDKVKPLVKTDK